MDDPTLFLLQLLPTKMLRLRKSQPGESPSIVAEHAGPMNLILNVPKPRFVQIFKELMDIIPKLSFTHSELHSELPPDVNEVLAEMDNTKAFHYLRLVLNTIHLLCGTGIPGGVSRTVGIVYETGEVALVDEVANKACWSKNIIVTDHFVDDIVAFQK